MENSSQIKDKYIIELEVVNENLKLEHLDNFIILIIVPTNRKDSTKD
jgi:hypothetical protein